MSGLLLVKVSERPEKQMKVAPMAIV